MKKAAIYMGAAAWRSFLSTASSRTVRAFNGLAWSRWRALSAMLSWPGGRLMRGSASERESVSSTETRTETSGGIISRQRLTSGCPPRLVTRDYVDPTLACPSPGLAGDFFSPADGQRTWAAPPSQPLDSTTLHPQRILLENSCVRSSTSSSTRLTFTSW